MAGFGKTVAATAGERKQKQVAKGNLVERRECKNPELRAKLEKTPHKWLRHYMAALYPLPWSKGHKQMISDAVYASKTGTGVADAAPRGEGKTSILRGVSLYLVATGREIFPVTGGWTHKASTESYRLWLNMLHNSKNFNEDYPEICQPFELSTHSARLAHLRWKDNGENIGADVRAVDKMIILPDSRGAIAAASVQGDIKGLSCSLPSGAAIRPSLLLLDDAQDPKRAGNPTYVKDMMDLFERQWFCLSGPQTRITVMVACTVAAKNDVSEQFLSRRGFKSVRIARVESWPKGWDDRKSKTRALWDEWNDARLDGIDSDDEGKAGLAFYKKHKKVLTAGMKVSWAERYDQERGDPDALYSAMVDFYEIGEEAFASEHQNSPLKKGVSLYELTPQIIESRTDQDRLPNAVPSWAHLVIAATDVNPSYALTSVVVAFGRDQVAAVLWYGLYNKAPLPVTKEMPPAVARKVIYEALAKHGRELAALPCRPNTWIIDGGGSPEGTVIDLAANSPRICGLEAVCSFGRGWKMYKPTSKHKNVLGEQLHRVIKSRNEQWVLYNADYWRETTQRGWTGEVGSPGSCTLPKGRHTDFALQVCREQLRGKDDVGGRTVWVWDQAPGPHDYGDCMQMAYMGAAMRGVGTGGFVQPRQQQRRRSITHVKI